MAAAIVEFDALADPVRAAAEDDDLLPVRRRALIGELARERRLIGRIHVGGGGGEFRGAGVDALESGANAERVTLLRHLGLQALGQHGKARVRKSHRLQRAHAKRVGRQAVGLDLQFHVDDAAHLAKKPWIDLARIEDLVIGPAEPHRLRHLQETVRRRRAECGADRVLVVAAAESLDLDFVEPGQPGLQPAQRLLQALLEGAADRHHFADRLHRRRQGVGGAGKFFERKAWNLGDDVVDGRLERRRRRAAGNVVGDFIERVADRELGRDLGDRESGRLRGQRRGARHPRVHLDHDHAPVGGIDAELHIGAAGLDADFAQHRQRGVAHDLVFLVGQRQRRRDGDGIAGMHAHRIEVLDRADDDAIVLLVAYHLHLELFPAEHQFLDQDFVGRGGVEAAFDDVEKLFLVVGDAAAGAAHGEGRADDRGQPDLGQRHQRLAERVLLVALAALAFAERPLPLALFQRRAGQLLAFGLVFVAVGLLQRRGVGEPRFRRLQADLLHRVAEKLAILGLVDGVRRGADHLDVEFIERALPAQRQRTVQRGLAAHGRQQRKAARDDVAFLLDDLGDDFGRDRLDIGGISQFRVGHDGGRIGIDEDDAVALFLQRLHRLGAGIVEFAGLADHDGTSADDQDGGDICSFGHQLSDWILGTKKGRAAARPLSQERGSPLARGWSLDQIPHPRNPQKRAINGEIGVRQGLGRELSRGPGPSTLSFARATPGSLATVWRGCAELA